jgi:hypothetical protein
LKAFTLSFDDGSGLSFIWAGRQYLTAGYFCFTLGVESTTIYAAATL